MLLAGRLDGLLDFLISHTGTGSNLLVVSYFDFRSFYIVIFSKIISVNKHTSANGVVVTYFPSKEMLRVRFPVRAIIFFINCFFIFFWGC
jgi:hypothetical protein